jgi:membrane-bound metal-dependent hydrolase YbcI (DUF457 family)
MNIVSHLLYPAFFAQSANAYRAFRQQPFLFSWKQLLLISLCGGLPDILSPHTGLGERYASFSHSLWFLSLALLIAILLAARLQKFKNLIYFCFLAVVLHFVGDMVAGGINLFAPFGRRIVGKYYIPFKYWIPLDIAGLLFLSVPSLYNRATVRARPVLLVSGCAISLVAAGIVLLNLDSETILIKRIRPPEVDQVQLRQAERAWNTLFEKWRSGIFEPVSNEYSEKMRAALTPQFQKGLFRQFEENFGEYQKITFVEAIKGRFGFPQILLYQFKASFSKRPHQPEIGILFDSNGKISGFQIKGASP